MGFPKLKNALFCRILTYVVVLGLFIAPIVLLACIPVIPVQIKVAAFVVFGAGLIYYLIKNFILLMGMDLFLAMLHGYNTARRQYPLPKAATEEKILRRVRRFGKTYPCHSAKPQPIALQYKASASMLIYASGIEKIIAVYHTPFLDKQTYSAIFRSAKSNSNYLKGKKKPLLLDPQQKKAPLNRVTVVLIFADSVDMTLAPTLFDLVGKEAGDGDEISYLPCIIDLHHRICVFDSVRSPYVGFGYPVKNRGYKMIKKIVFGGRFTKSNAFVALPDQQGHKDIDIRNDTLWKLWRTMKYEIIISQKEMKKRFSGMQHGQIEIEDGEYLYLKWKEAGILLAFQLDNETMTASVDSFDTWDYPKSNKIGKQMHEKMERRITEHFAELGYTVRFIEPFEEKENL